MLTTIEAEIDVNGNVKFLEPLKITKKSRAIVTLLDDETVKRRPVSEAEARLAEERFARHFGAISSGDSKSANNEKIDADLIRAYEDAHDDE